MCGILGIISPRSSRPSVDDATLARMRDTMTHRGPDDAGLWRHQNAALAHRRLSVIDVSSNGHQPMLTPDNRFAIVYNGELYNDAALRQSLAPRGINFKSQSDTETLLHLLAHPQAGIDWQSIDQARGMYALGLWDSLKGELILARDPLGIKPLYYALANTPSGPELVFASELPAILAHPHITPRPDAVTVSSYLTTIRTTLGRRTLFEGVCCVRPGEILRITTDGGLTLQTLRDPYSLPRAPQPAVPLYDFVIDTVRAHLRSDVPICCLLSGGLDSSIVSTIAMMELGQLHTFCAGGVSPAQTKSGPDMDDFAFARLMAQRLGTRHTEAPVTQEMFGSRWPEMIDRLGLPLSTPNEVAINQVARTLRAAGKVVTLSGEGADELFAGYLQPMDSAAAFEALQHAALERDPAAAARARASFQIDSNSWIERAAKKVVLAPEFLRASEMDECLLATYTDIMRDCEQTTAQSPAPDPPGEAHRQTHLDFYRRVNLAGLLQRLDTATMLESVEGRTPLADAKLAGLARALPMSEKFHVGKGVSGTKVALRRAFEADLPPEIVEREKASFPLPFQEWMGLATAALDSGYARSIFTPEAIDVVRRNHANAWKFAWPMLNIAQWGKRWWG